MGKSWLLLGLLFVGSAHAGYGVSPVKATYDPSQKIVPLTIINEGDRPLTVQVFIDQWTVKDGSKHLEKAEGMRASPASLVTVEPGSTQMVRILRSNTSQDEAAYQVRVREIRAREPGDPPTIFAVQHKLAWFWRPANAKPVLSVTRSGSKWSVHNSGNATADIVGPTGRLAYVMPNESLLMDPIDESSWKVNNQTQSIEVL